MDSENSAHRSTGVVAAIISPEYKNHQAAHSDECDKNKGYVQMNTNLGSLAIELHLDSAPKTCEYFIRHCRNGCYDGTIFHRSVKNSMVCI